jgi:signal transduction histidine kinase
MILDIASASSQQLQSLVRSILDIRHLEAGRPLTELSYFDLPGTVSEAVQTISATLRQHQAELVLCYDENLPPAYGEQDMIRRVLVNLLDNCAKYSPAGTTVSISVRRAPDSSHVLVSVSDQGAGVSPEHRQRIFHKFHRSQANGRPAVKGLGLGLAFCRMAVEAHSGTIWVDDAPGGGARFNFTLATSPF